MLAREAIINALSYTEYSHICGSRTADKVRTKLETTYKGDEYVKQAKSQGLKVKYEDMWMSENETIASFMQKINDLVCAIKCVGETLKEDEVKTRF